MSENSISAFVGTSRKVLFFRFNDGSTANIWTSQASDPTYRVNGGEPIALTDRTAYAISFGFGPSYVSYPIAAVLPIDVLTFSAPPDWVSFGTGETAPEAIDEPVTNWSDIEMFPMTDPITMPLGMNTWGPNRVLPADLCRNMLKGTNGGGGYTAIDANFWPAAIDDHAYLNIQRKWLDTGIDALGTGGVPGTYWITWDDYSSGRDKLAWIEAHNSNDTTVTPVGSKLTVATTGSYTRYRQQYTITLGPTPADQGLGLWAMWNSVDVKNVQPIGPENDPDSTEIVHAHVKNVLARISCIRFVQATEGIGSNVAIYDHCRKRADMSGEIGRSIDAQLIQVEPIFDTTIRWNGETFNFSKWTPYGTPNTDPTFLVGIYCTTTAPHGFYTFQNIDLSQIYNNDYTDPDDVTNHCGLQVQGISGPIWMRFGGQTGVVCYVVDDTHFIVYPGFIVQTAGVADPIGTQTFDITSGRSVVRTYVPSDSSISYGEAIQIASEMVPPASAHINLSECMIDQCVADVAAECLAVYQSLGDNAPPFVYIELADETWNPGIGSAYYRINALSRFVGHNVTPGATRQCTAYLAHRLATIFKDVFAAAGLGDRVKRGLWFQRFGDVELQFAFDNGLTFESGGCSSYYYSTFPAGSWDAYTDSAQIHDLWEWMLQYLVQGQLVDMLANVAQYMPGMEVVAYEGGTDWVMPAGLTTAAQARDFHYHPRCYRTTMLEYANAQRAGFSQVNLYTYTHGINVGGTAWPYAMTSTQPAGLGVDPPNVTSTGKGPTVNQDLTNVSPPLQALHDWLFGSPTPTILTPGVASLGTRTPTSIAMTSTDATGGTPPYSYEWQLSTDSGSTWNPAVGTGVTTLSTTITGLTPGTSYEIRLQYTDSGS